jgi:hypothetical protein
MHFPNARRAEAAESGALSKSGSKGESRPGCVE